MKNIEIITLNTALLVEQGIIQPENIIDTVPGWNKRGYKIKKGAEHVAAFPIWMPRTKKKEQTEDEFIEETAKKGRFYMKKCCFFTNEQVEPAPAE